MSVPAYVAPSVGPAGLTIPTYPSILQDNLNAFLNIYGSNQFVDPSSAIYQLLSILSLKQADCCTGLQLAYNQSSPLTAVGAGLDRLCKLIGIARLAATFSAVVLTCVGTPGATVLNGVAEDVNGYFWTLPTSFTFPIGGSINLTATCTTPGPIVAEAGQVIIINYPASGAWTSVTNAAASSPGSNIEADSQLRARYAISVAEPSLTLLAGTEADLLALSGVTRVNVLENPTGTTDSYGNGPHSLTCVVQASTATPLQIATVIYNNRGIGCNTLAAASGATLITTPVADPNMNGQITNIGYVTPAAIPVYVTMTVHGLSSFTSATLAAIQVAIVSYLNSLGIGESVVYSELYGAALNARSNPDIPTFSIRSVASGLAASPSGTTDIAMLFYQAASGVTANIVVTSV